MIELNHVTKAFGKTKALDCADCSIGSGSVFGLVGSNGAGKSTLLRLISGIYLQDSGEITIEGQNVFDNAQIKKHCVFINDNPYLQPGATLESLSKLYRTFYDSFSMQEYNRLVNLFNLNPKSQLSDFSKGMRRQAVIIAALSCRCRYLIMDETLDGLDPVMRALVKKLIYQSVIDNGSTAVISSHSLRELEDACDNLAMLHKGKVIFQRDIQNIGSSISKVQVVTDKEINRADFADIDILNHTRNGSVSNLIVRGGHEQVIEILKEKEPLLLEVLPLSLEEVFIYELQDKGYTFDEILENGGDDYEN